MTGTPRVSFWEINAEDGPALVAFYRQVFGWQATEDTGTGVTRLETGDGTDGGIPGAIFTGKGALPTHRCLYVDVEDVDRVCAAVEALGQPILQGPFDFQGRLRLAFFRDPEGHMLGITGPVRGGGGAVADP